jgi:electron transfer flavoprotein beta subunit
VSRIIVGIKRVVDANVRVRVKADGSGMDIAGVAMAINPFCEIALEEAIRLREAGRADEVIAVTIGPPQAQESLRAALALGADRALRIDAPVEIEPLAVAKLLRAVVEREGADLVLLGKQSIDGDNNQTGQMLAGMLGWGQATFASKIECGAGEVTVTREVDNGLEVLALKLPAVITADLRLNTPRYASLPNIMKARKKPLEELPADRFGIDLTPRVTVLALAPPAMRQRGRMLASVDELVEALKGAGLVREAGR